MFLIMCDPSSESNELCLTEITRSGSEIFFVCLVGVWQRNFEPAVCVYGTMGCDPPRIISVKHSSVLPDDGSHMIQNMLE